MAETKRYLPKKCDISVLFNKQTHPDIVGTSLFLTWNSPFCPCTVCCRFLSNVINRYLFFSFFQVNVLERNAKLIAV